MAPKEQLREPWQKSADSSKSADDLVPPKDLPLTFRVRALYRTPKATPNAAVQKIIINSYLNYKSLKNNITYYK